MLGLGDVHGTAAIEWTVDNMNRSFVVIEKGQYRKVLSFTDPERFDFEFELGDRSAYRFPFSGQLTAAQTLQVPSVSTYLAFDSKIYTYIIGLLQRLYLLKILSKPKWRTRAISTIEKYQFGSDLCARSVRAKRVKQGKPHQVTIGLKSYREGELTAHVAIAMAEYLYRGNFPKGIYHSDELF